MLISLCIPCHNRTADLRQTLPLNITAAQRSPETEIVILDYNSPDDLADYVAQVQGFGTTRIVYRKYEGRPYYHMAHARNLSVRAASGEYVVILSADIGLLPGYLPYVRRAIAEHGYVWMWTQRYRGVIVCQWAEFDAAGGFDERFEFYGPEDADLHERLERRGGTHGMVPGGMLVVIPTPNDVKGQNYRLPISKWRMGKLMRPIIDENRKRGVLVANEGQKWGDWDA